MKKYVLITGLIVNILVLFLSIGFARFSSTLAIEDIEVAIRIEKNIRVTNFYPVTETSNTSSYNVDSVHTRLYLPNPDSEVTYKVEVTNISSFALQIDDIIVTPSNITYTLDGYNLGENICDEVTGECNTGVKKEFYITFKYKENGYDNSNPTGEYLVDAEFEWGYNYKVVFHSNTSSNQEVTQIIPYDINFPLQLNSFTNEGYIFSKWSLTPDGTGLTYRDGAIVKNLSTDGRTIDLYAQWKEPNEGIYYPGDCVFNGQGNDIVGACAEGEHIDYINTHITPFTQQDYARNFVLSFILTDADDSQFVNNPRNTIVNTVYEGSDNIAGQWPGFNLRVENGKYQMQGGDGRSSSTKKQFTRAELEGKEIKIIRHNNGSTIKLYYMVGGDGPFVLRDVTNLYAYFDTPLTFGAILETDNTTPDRFFKGTLTDISFEYVEDGISLNDLIYNELAPDDPDFPVVFEVDGPCTFNGSSANITGCEDYANQKYIDTGINLFDSTNASKDFEITFKIDSYVPTDQEDSQVTLMNAFKERSPKGFGAVLRRNTTKLELVIRNDLLEENIIRNISSSSSTVRIVRKNGHICYSIDSLNYTYGLDFTSFDSYFTVPVTFGASINSSGQPFRYITGTLSDMKIRLGTINSENIVCEAP